MTTTISPTPLDQPIAAWLAHQRALGRRYDPEESILNSLREVYRPDSGAGSRSDKL
jgi:integrase/recombinase XerD